MNWANTSYSSTQTKNKKYKQKQLNSLKNKTKYILLVPEDALYRQNLFRLSNHQFQETLKKVLKDLNTLLYFSEEDFFDELQNSDSLRVCLQSCLVCLCKNSCYNLCSTKILDQNRQKIDFPNDYFTYYDKVNEVVLKIYFRIVHAQKKEHKQIIYNSWLLDIPKMVDFCMIYCVRVDQQDDLTNISIVQEILSKAIQSNPIDYARDFDDFINILYQDKLPLIHKDIKYLINLSLQSMEKAMKNFSDPLRSFLITSNKILFQIKDLYTMISYVYHCFPKKFMQKLATDHQVLEDSIRIFIEFIENTPLWKVTPFQNQFHVNFQDIHKTACECFFLNLKILKQIIARGDTLTNDFFSRAITSYSVHTMYFSSSKINTDYQKIYQTMIKTIIYHFKPHQVFFMREANSKFNFIKLTEDERNCIKKSFIEVQKIQKDITQKREDQSVSLRIKSKIQDFFKKAAKPKQENKILSVRQAKKSINNKFKIGQKMKQSLEFSVKQNELKMTENTSELDFSELLEEQNLKEEPREESDLDLSFQALKSCQEKEEENGIFDILADLSLEKQRIHNEPIDPQILQKIYDQEQKMRLLYTDSLRVEQDDQWTDEQVETEIYYQSNKPQFGQFTDFLIQKEEWKSKYEE